MNKEEQEAIKEVKSYIEWVKDRGTDTDKNIEILLNLISKLQKELELEKEKRIFWHDKYFELKQICEDEGLKLGF